MRLIAYLVAAIVLAAISGPAGAHDHRAGDLRITHPWTRATNGDVTAVYMKIMNTGSTPDRLLRATTEVGEATIHESKTESGVAKMRPVESVAIPARKEVSFQPGGLHIMLMGLKQPLTEGFGIPMTLVFEKAGEVHIDAMVQKAGAKPMH
ncbi:MAG: copper chaperone PCu(A)C [Alphaproteobacteria bacterium]